MKKFVKVAALVLGVAFEGLVGAMVAYAMVYDEPRAVESEWRCEGDCDAGLCAWCDGEAD